MNLPESMTKELHSLNEKLNVFDKKALQGFLEKIYTGPINKPMFLSNITDKERQMLPLLMKFGAVQNMVSEQMFSADRNIVNAMCVHMYHQERDIEDIDMGHNDVFKVGYKRIILENSPLHKDITVESQLHIIPRGKPTHIYIELDQIFQENNVYLNVTVSLHNPSDRNDIRTVIFSKDKIITNGCRKEELYPLVLRDFDRTLANPYTLTLMSKDPTGDYVDSENQLKTRLDLAIIDDNILTIQVYHGDRLQNWLNNICTAVCPDTSKEQCDLNIIVPTVGSLSGYGI